MQEPFLILLVRLVQHTVQMDVLRQKYCSRQMDGKNVWVALKKLPLALKQDRKSQKAIVMEGESSHINAHEAHTASLQP
ncbi:hypothetical protein NDU88_005036 [Pleurodeles waltl]|uniref:Uncharacterized protein n=1 Tax=Pleurodeles waltl TaxID=8319 RepID=A0AAV7WAW9_PLEWA|nr:hypothetical protein NDU88_005036 [Pleurodeles waltl]